MRKGARATAIVTVAGAVVIGLLLVVTSGGSPAIAPGTQRALLRLVRAQARTNGDGHPVDIEVSHTTYRAAQKILGGSSSSHPPEDAPVYLVAMRGRFNPLAGFVPNRVYFKSHPRPPLEVLEIAVTASPLQQYESYSGQRLGYPKLSNVVATS